MAAENKPLYARIWGSPFLWGLAATAAFYYTARQPDFRTPFVDRYFDGHIINRFEVMFFFIGMAALGITFLRMRGQQSLLAKCKSQAILTNSDALDPASWRSAITGWPEALKNSLFGQRLDWAISYVERTGATEGLQQELREQAAAQSDAFHNGAALVRIIIWAIPILGFLGTVVGITIAIAELNPEALEQSMNKVTAGLAVAFDTTAIALVLSMILMFCQYVNDQTLAALLSQTDLATESAIIGRVFIEPADDEESDWNLLRRTAERLAQGVKDSVELQRQQWQAALTQERERWNEATTLLLAKLENSLEQRGKQTSELTVQSLRRLHDDLITELKSAQAQNATVWNDQQAAAREQTTALERHTETIRSALETVNEIGGLETALNRNLKALSGANDFARVLDALQQSIALLKGEVAKTQIKAFPSTREDRGLAA